MQYHPVLPSFQRRFEQHRHCHRQEQVTLVYVIEIIWNTVIIRITISLIRIRYSITVLSSAPSAGAEANILTTTESDAERIGLPSSVTVAEAVINVSPSEVGSTVTVAPSIVT